MHSSIADTTDSAGGGWTCGRLLARDDTDDRRAKRRSERVPGLHMKNNSTTANHSQDILIQLAKAVATSTAALVLKAKHLSSECDDKQAQDNVIHSATQCAFATSQLVACARVCSELFIFRPNAIMLLVSAKISNQINCSCRVLFVGV